MIKPWSARRKILREERAYIDHLYQDQESYLRRSRELFVRSADSMELAQVHRNIAEQTPDIDERMSMLRAWKAYLEDAQKCERAAEALIDSAERVRADADNRAVNLKFAAI
jgi:hypothetical protein